MEQIKQLEKIQNYIKKEKDYYKISFPTQFSNQERNFMRVSQIPQIYQSKTRFNQWYKSLALEENENKNLNEDELIKIGEKKGEKKKNDQAKKGTKKHKYIEDFFKKRQNFSLDEWKEKLENFYPFVNIFNPLALENKVFYENTFNRLAQPTFNGKLLGLCGTFDALGEVDCKALSFQKNGKPIFNKSLEFVMDWKYPSNPKYPVKKYKDNTIYPLIPYGLQLACYIASINQRTNLNLQRGIVVIAPENSKCCYPYLFSKEAIQWYWENVKKMLIDIYFFESKVFDYTFFEKETYKKNFHGTRLYLR